MRRIINSFFKTKYRSISIILLSFFISADGKSLPKSSLIAKEPAKAIQPMQPAVTPVHPKPVIAKPHVNGVHPTKNDPEILDINKSVKIINNQHDCNATNWENNQEDSCQCCLTYGEGRFGEEQTADQIIDHCVNTSKQCTMNSIDNIKRKYNARSTSSEDFLNTLYSSTTIVHKMTFDPALLGSQGKLTEYSLPIVLEQAYNEGKLNDQDFSTKECLKAKSLAAGGINTAQLFSVTSTCIPSKELLYIIKESKKGLSESTNLQKIKEYPGMKELIAPKIKKGFPSISLPFFYFSYHPHHQNIHYIAAMPAADGVVLCKLTTDFRDNQSPENAETLKTAYAALGTEFANFHKNFMQPIPGKKLGKTIIHGDAHCNNFFYDKKKRHFTFIDNETMVRSFRKRKSPKADFIRLIFPPFSTNETVFKGLITGIKPDTYLQLTLKPFLQNYISVYNIHDQKQVLQELKEMLTSKISVTFLDFDKKFIQELITKSIIPIFNEIEKTINQ